MPVTRSWGVLALRLQERMGPCSVPIMNLVGPAAGEHSSDTAPITVSPPRSCTVHVMWMLQCCWLPCYDASLMQCKVEVEGPNGGR